jgi:hypothetical protein
MNRKFIFTLTYLLIACTTILHAATTIVRGQDSTYIGKQLCLYTWNDGWEYTKTIFDTCTVAPNGEFQFKFNLEETRKAQITLGKYEGCLFVEPGKIYSINLPNYEEPSTEDKLNPYFKPQELLLSFNNLPIHDINQLITKFEDAFDQQWMELLSKEINPQRIEQSIAYIDSICPISNNDFMEQYRLYRYALMVNLHASSAPDLSIRTYFLKQPVLYHQPAYWEAFEAIFPHFDHLSGLYENPALFELAIMQKVNTGDLPISKLNHITTPKNKEIAHFIEKKKEVLQKGHPIDLGTLVNIQGDSIHSKDLNFPKAYIAFTNTRLNECESIIAYADKMNKKFQHRCLFLVIFTDESESAIQKACKNIRNKFWFFSVSKNTHLQKQLNQTHVPAYYLIDANSTLLQAPAPQPKNFEP